MASPLALGYVLEWSFSTDLSNLSNENASNKVREDAALAEDDVVPDSNHAAGGLRLTGDAKGLLFVVLDGRAELSEPRAALRAAAKQTAPYRCFQL
jgi:hypothetical protein